jgi:hypothetical protein
MNSHNGGLVDGGNLSSTVLLSVVEGVSGHSLRSLVSDELDGLNNTIDDLDESARSSQPPRPDIAHLVLNTGVLSLGVFSDQNLPC